MSIINPPRSQDKYVYHYTTLETARDFILPSGTIRFNTLSAVNDPREAKLWEPAVTVANNLNLNLDEWRALEAEVAASLRSGVKLCCFSMDGIGTTNPEDFNSRCKRGYALPSLWHHYGNKHQGVCLMFDRALMHQAFEQSLVPNRLFAGPIQYTDEGWVRKLAADPFRVNFVGVQTKAEARNSVAKHFRVWKDQLYFRKLTDWSNEAEYRWLYLDEDDVPRNVSFGDALKGIIVGEAVSPEDVKMIQRLSIPLRTQFARMRWSNGQPSIQDYTEPFLVMGQRD